MPIAPSLVQVPEMSGCPHGVFGAVHPAFADSAGFGDASFAAGLPDEAFCAESDAGAPPG
jgi:hypothetical protein